MNPVNSQCNKCRPQQHIITATGWTWWWSSNLYFDNFYASPKLLLELEKHKPYGCGTVASIRGQFPTEFMGGESVFIQSGNLLLVHWKDKRDVYMMSLIHENGVTEIQCRPGDKVTKPNMIIAYNKYMGGVDKYDQYNTWIIIWLARNLCDGGNVPCFTLLN